MTFFRTLTVFALGSLLAVAATKAADAPKQPSVFDLPDGLGLATGRHAALCPPANTKKPRVCLSMPSRRRRRTSTPITTWLVSWPCRARRTIRSRTWKSRSNSVFPTPNIWKPTTTWPSFASCRVSKRPCRKPRKMSRRERGTGNTRPYRRNSRTGSTSSPRRTPSTIRGWDCLVRSSRSTRKQPLTSRSSKATAKPESCSSNGTRKEPRQATTATCTTTATTAIRS